jgi:tRNA (cmo5U34)-methyltransferase
MPQKFPLPPSSYDQNIQNILPNYLRFHDSVIDLVQTAVPTPKKWLDTGCGTGTLTVRLLPLFPKTTFVLADPTPEMLAAAKEKIKSENVTFVSGSSQELECEDNTFDVITAILSHHYLSKTEKKKAIANCFRMLKPGGVFVYFEHIRPYSEKGRDIAFQRWHHFQIENGRTLEEAKFNTDRFDKEYFPFTVADHLNLLEKIGFGCAEILWVSYMQGGFYAMK